METKPPTSSGTTNQAPLEAASAKAHVPAVPRHLVSAPAAESRLLSPRPKRARLPKGSTQRRPRQHHAHLNPEHRYALLDLGWLQFGLSGTALKVLCVLSSHADRDRGNCFPSVETIAREAGLADNTRQAQRAIRELEKTGAAIVHFRLRATSLYWVQPAPTREEALQEASRLTKRGPFKHCLTPAKLTTLPKGVDLTTVTLAEETILRDHVKRPPGRRKRKRLPNVSSSDCDSLNKQKLGVATMEVPIDNDDEVLPL
jgi:hypothetical protein